VGAYTVFASLGYHPTSRVGTTDDVHKDIDTTLEMAKQETVWSGHEENSTTGWTHYMMRAR